MRFPVFLMGILGGLQVLRAHQNHDSFDDPNLCTNLLHTLLPWGSDCCRKQGKDSGKKQSIEEQTKIWRTRLDFNAFIYVGFLITLTVTKLALDLNFQSDDGKIYYL